MQLALLHAIGNPSKPLRHTVGTNVAVIVGVGGLPTWPELLSAIVHCLESNDPDSLEGALDALYKVSLGPAWSSASGQAVCDSPGPTRWVSCAAHKARRGQDSSLWRSQHAVGGVPGCQPSLVSQPRAVSAAAASSMPHSSSACPAASRPRTFSSTHLAGGAGQVQLAAHGQAGRPDSVRPLRLLACLQIAEDTPVQLDSEVPGAADRPSAVLVPHLINLFKSPHEDAKCLAVSIMNLLAGGMPHAMAQHVDL